MKKNIKNILKLVILGVFLSIASYAWFYSGTTTSTTLETKVNAVNTIEVSLDNGDTWNSSSGIHIYSNIVFNNETTGDGINMYTASLKDGSGNPISFKTAIANEDYLEFTILFKTTLPTKIFLEKSSKISPTCGIENIIGEEVPRKSSDGDFSRDFISGAVRVAFIENDYSQGKYSKQNYTKLVWAPNKNYELRETDDKYQAITNSTSTQNYNYLKPVTKYTSVEASVDNLVDEINASYDLKNSGGDKYLLEIGQNEPVYKALTIRVWVEGNDRETVSPLLGGMFDIKLSFVGLEKESNTKELEVSKSGNTLNGLTSEMEYKINNGIWTPYTNGELNFENQKVFVRYKETDKTFPSEAIEFEF